MLTSINLKEPVSGIFYTPPNFLKLYFCAPHIIQLLSILVIVIPVRSNTSHCMNGLCTFQWGSYPSKVAITVYNIRIHSGEGFPPNIPRLVIPTGTANTTHTITCNAEGFPPPDISWIIYKDKSVANTTSQTKVSHSHM